MKWPFFCLSLSYNSVQKFVTNGVFFAGLFAEMCVCVLAYTTRRVTIYILGTKTLRMNLMNDNSSTRESHDDHTKKTNEILKLKLSFIQRFCFNWSTCA